MKTVEEVVASPLPAGGRDRERGVARQSALSEWRLPLLMGLVLAIVTAIPYAYAYAVQSPGHVFLGFFYLGDDANTYLAKMRQGWEGAWAWQNRYTTESSPTAYLFMFWIVLGHIAARWALESTRPGWGSWTDAELTLRIRPNLRSRMPGSARCTSAIGASTSSR